MFSHSSQTKRMVSSLGVGVTARCIFLLDSWFKGNDAEWILDGVGKNLWRKVRRRIHRGWRRWRWAIVLQRKTMSREAATDRWHWGLWSRGYMKTSEGIWAEVLHKLKFWSNLHKKWYEIASQTIEPQTIFASGGPWGKSPKNKARLEWRWAKSN